MENKEIEEQSELDVAPDQTEEVAPDQTEEVAPKQDELEEGDMFPRDYVVKLREENAKYRTRAQDRDALAERLHTALVAATGRLQDPSDLPFDEAHLSDAEALSTSVDTLLQAKPHLASRKPTGSIGQGVSVESDTFSLMGALRQNAS